MAGVRGGLAGKTRKTAVDMAAPYTPGVYGATGKRPN